MGLHEPCSTITVELIRYIQDHPETVYHMDQFLVRYQDPIFNFIRLTIGNHHDSLDLTNKVLLTLSKKVKEVRIKKAFNHLAIKVIKGEISNYWKSRKTKKMRIMRRCTMWHNGEEISLIDALESDEDKAEDILQLFMVRDIIDNMPVTHAKQVFLLKYRDHESIENIASKLGITRYQVKKCIEQIHHSVGKLVNEGRD